MLASVSSSGLRSLSTRKATNAAVLRGLAAMSLVLLPNLWIREAAAQSRLVSEENLRAAILESRAFEPIELDSLDLNRDSVVDVADLTLFLFRNAQLVPSVSFKLYTQRIHEGERSAAVELVFSQPFKTATTIHYAVGGSASPGTDFNIAGLDTVEKVGSISVAEGDTEASLRVDIPDDGGIESSETLRFSIVGGSPRTYYAGSLQSHILYLDDNDGTWTAGLELPNGAGYASLNIEMIQQNGDYSGRVLADGKLIPQPDENDPGRAGEDGWEVSFAGRDDSLRIEIGPVPVDQSLSVFEIDYVRYFLLDARPGVTAYSFNPYKTISGEVTEILVPVKSRLGPEWQERAYLRRESKGAFIMQRNPSNVESEEVPLNAAK